MSFLKTVAQCFVYVSKIDGKWIAVIIDENERIVSLSLPKGSEGEAVYEAKRVAVANVSYKFRSEMDPSTRRVGREVVEFINSYIKGDKPKITFKLNVEGLTKFMNKVLAIVSSIPRGFVTCYGCVAEVIENPYACRAVGRALAMNPWPIIIPCHRVVKSDLTLGGYRGGLDMKRELLRIEGVAVTLAGRVLPAHFLEARRLRELSRDAGEKLLTS
ncbi:MAG: MGMT family protein [Candidatus Nezhaarchaeales archaeon]